MPIVDSQQLSAREYTLLEAERDENRLSREHAITLKRLELEIKRADNEARVELKQLEAKWASWLRLPSLILRLPLFLVLGIAYCIAVIRKYDPPKKFWDLLQ